MKTKSLVDGYDSFPSKGAQLRDAGACIRSHRIKIGYSQEQLGKMVGLGKAQISRMEKSRNLTTESIIKLMKALGADVTLLVRDDTIDTDAFISDTVDCVGLFARNNGIPQKNAFNYLKTFGGIDFLRDNFSLEQSYSIEETVEHLTLICHRNGGAI